MKKNKKILICCNSKEEAAAIEKQIDHIDALKDDPQIPLEERLFPLLDALDKNVQNLFHQKEKIKRGELKVNDAVLFSDIYPATKNKMPDYGMFKKIRDVFGNFTGNDWVNLVKLKNLLDAKKEAAFCCSFSDLSYIKKINDFDGIVVPCELSWDADRTDCEPTQYAGISLVQYLRNEGVVIPVVFTSVMPCEHIVTVRKDAEIIRTPALQHRFLDGLTYGWKDILRTFDGMHSLNQTELRYTQLLYCSLKGVLLQIKHAINNCSNTDEFRRQIKYVIEKQFGNDESLLEQFGQTDNLELFCQNLIDLMDKQDEVTGEKENVEFLCKNGEEPIKIAYLEDNTENDRNARRFVKYIARKNDEMDRRNQTRKEGEHPEKFRFARVAIKTTKEDLLEEYEKYDVIIADIDIKNEKNEVVALGFEVVRELIEDQGAYGHVYYIVTNVTRSFYDQIKIPGINRVRLKDEVFGSDEKICRFLYGIKEAVDSKQPLKSDCQYIFDKLYAFIKNKRNYPIGYKFNYMKERKEVNSFDELEALVKGESAKLVHVFLSNFKDSKIEGREGFRLFENACAHTQIHIGGDKENDLKDHGMLGRGNGKLVSTMMKKKSEVPSSSNVNAFMVRLILRRFFLFVREFVKSRQIKTIGDQIHKNAHGLSVDDLACRAIGPSGAYKEYDDMGSAQSKCLTEILMLTEDERKLESMLTPEEVAFIEHGIDLNG